MAIIRGEYSTVTEIRSTYLGATGTGDDALILDLLRSVCRDIDTAAQRGRHFYPLTQTRTFDIPHDDVIFFDDDLLAVTTLTNGNATTIASTKYYLLTQNYYPKWGLCLKPTSGLVWLPDSSGEVLQVVSLAGIWGYHADYDNAFPNLTASSDNVTAVTNSGALTSTATSLTLSAASNGKAGQLWKIDDELIYVGSLSGTAASQLERGVNGTTAAAHDSGDAITVWTVDGTLAHLARESTAMRYRQRENPGIDSMTLPDGTVVTIPKDISAHIAKRVVELGLRRTV